MPFSCARRRDSSGHSRRLGNKLSRRAEIASFPHNVTAKKARTFANLTFCARQQKHFHFSSKRAHFSEPHTTFLFDLCLFFFVSLTLSFDCSSPTLFFMRFSTTYPRSVSFSSSVHTTLTSTLPFSFSLSTFQSPSFSFSSHHLHGNTSLAARHAACHMQGDLTSPPRMHTTDGTCSYNDD